MFIVSVVGFGGPLLDHGSQGTVWGLGLLQTEQAPSWLKLPLWLAVKLHLFPSGSWKEGGQGPHFKEDHGGVWLGPCPGAFMFRSCRQSVPGFLDT